jgi:hypothetical protein
MLRVRPTFSTSNLGGARRILESLGLVTTEEGEGWAILDAGSGRVALKGVESGSAADGTVEFAVEIRDPKEFTRRTVEAGGRAVVVPDKAPGKQAVTISGDDGFTFTAHQTIHGATCADADPLLAVRAIWLTPDVPAAAKTLAAIGAKPRDGRDSSGEANAVDLRAKNGGILTARRADTVGSGGLSFEYDGGLEVVAERLARSGAEVETNASGLVVTGPDVAFTVMTLSVRML